jgi:hypothetical protein
MLYRVYPLYILLFSNGNSHMLSKYVFGVYHQQAIPKRLGPAEGPTSIGVVGDERLFDVRWV